MDKLITQQTILVADDDPISLDIVSMILNQSGYTVIIAQDGGEAVEICHKQNPDLLVTDYEMPVLNGIEVSRQTPPDIPVILMSSKLPDNDRDDANIVAYIGKGNAEHLLSVVRQALPLPIPPASHL